MVFFAVFTGIAINKMSTNSARPIKNLFNTISKLVFRMIKMIIQLSPYGAFALTAVVGIEALVDKFESDHDDYNSIMVKAIADRLAEAKAMSRDATRLPPTVPGTADAL